MITIVTSLFFAGLLSLSQVGNAAQIKIDSLQRPLAPTTQAGQNILAVLHTSAPRLHTLNHTIALLHDVHFYASQYSSPTYAQDYATDITRGKVLNIASVLGGLYSLTYHKENRLQKLLRGSSVLMHTLILYHKYLTEKIAQEKDEKQKKILIARKEEIDLVLFLVGLPALGIPALQVVQRIAQTRLGRFALKMVANNLLEPLDLAFY